MYHDGVRPDVPSLHHKGLTENYQPNGKMLPLCSIFAAHSSGKSFRYYIPLSTMPHLVHGYNGKKHQHTVTHADSRFGVNAGVS